MEDEAIVLLYLSRDERAIRETEHKYGRYLGAVSRNVLGSAQDSEEALSDGYLRIWNAIPPHRPRSLKAFAAKLVRAASIDRYRRLTAQRRVPSEYQLSLSELEECVPATLTEANVDDGELRAALTEYLASLSAEARNVFIRRYFLCEPVRAVAHAFSLSEPKTKRLLRRTREGLRTHLEQRGFTV